MNKLGATVWPNTIYAPEGSSSFSFHQLYPKPTKQGLLETWLERHLIHSRLGKVCSVTKIMLKLTIKSVTEHTSPWTGPTLKPTTTTWGGWQPQLESLWKTSKINLSQTSGSAWRNSFAKAFGTDAVELLTKFTDWNQLLSHKMGAEDCTKNR